MRICSAFRKEPRVPETKQEAGAVERGSRKTRLADIFSPSASDRWKLYWISRIKKKIALVSGSYVLIPLLAKNSRRGKTVHA